MVRSSNPNDIFNDIEKSLERAVIDVIDEINTIAISKTPVDTGYAQQQWRTIGKYKLGVTMDVVENTASYIGILDKGRHQDGKIWRGSKQAPDGIINPSLNNTIKDITNRRRKL